MIDDDTVTTIREFTKDWKRNGDEFVFPEGRTICINTVGIVRIYLHPVDPDSVFVQSGFGGDPWEIPLDKPISCMELEPATPDFLESWMKQQQNLV